MTDLAEEFEEEYNATNMDSKAEDTDPIQGFTDTLVNVLEGEHGSKVVTANAPRLWALLEALDENDDRRAEFYENIGSDFDNSDGEINRSALLKYLVLLALKDHDDDLVNSLKRAKDETEDTTDLL